MPATAAATARDLRVSAIANRIMSGAVDLTPRHDAPNDGARSGYARYSAGALRQLLRCNSDETLRFDGDDPDLMRARIVELTAA